MTDAKTFVVVSHTHWDREWYQPFETFRGRLVRMMDSLIELLQNDAEFKHFVLDGQSVPLDDYLEIRPDRRAAIEKLVRDGRLLVGPNYMLPDEFLIGAEAWVRNLMFGIRSAREYGGVMRVGYSPDAFGHIAHLPAILNGFGLDSVLIWRGVPKEITTSEFRWLSPDGSEVLVCHFPYGYGFMSTLPEDREGLAKSLDTVRKLLEPLATTKYVLVPNGTDHLPAHAGLSSVIKQANGMLGDSTMVHGNYPDFVAAVRQEIGRKYDELPAWQGEFRSSDRSHVLAGVLSTRMWLKQRYAYCEDLLARYAEPLVAWAHLLRRESPNAEKTQSDKRLLHHAWKLLLQNGPHDSVTGCSVDAVYDDVGLRFQKVDQIAQALIADAHGQIASAVAKPGEEAVVVYNSEHGPRTDFCTVQLPIADGRLPTTVVDAAGIETPVQIMRRGIHSAADRRERVLVGFVAGDVPAHGYKAFTIGYDAVAAPSAAGTAIENEFLRVTAEATGGTLTVEDKRTGRVLAGLNQFVDSGDCGDEYTYCPPDRDVFIDAPVAAAKVRVTESGPARWTVEVQMTYGLPAKLTVDRKARTDETVDCEIVSRVRLYAGVPRVEIETEVENHAQDHRLRAIFPSGVMTDHSRSEQHFGVIGRSTTVPEMPAGAPETPVGTYPQKTFSDLSDGEHGLLLANRGLPEYEVLTSDSGETALALTLLRCVSWLSLEGLATRPEHAGPMMDTPGAQLPGKWTFAYALIPHAGGWEHAWQEAHRFARPLRAVRVSGGTGALPAEKSLVSIDHPQIVPSAIKLAEDEDSLVVRVYNIADEPTSGNLFVREQFRMAEVVDLNEENSRPAILQGGGVRMALRQNEIETLRFTG